MKPELKAAIQRLNEEADSAKKHGVLRLQGFEDEFAADIALLIAEANTMADVRTALYGEAANSPGMAADPCASILERARHYQAQKAEADAMRVQLNRIEREENHMKRLADAQLVRIAGMEYWHKDIHENLADAVERTVRTRAAEIKILESAVNGLQQRVKTAEAELKAYRDAVDAQGWASDEPIRVLLDRVTSRIETAEAERDKWQADALLRAKNSAYWEARFHAACVKGVPLDQDPEIKRRVDDMESGREPGLAGDEVMALVREIVTREPINPPAPGNLIAHLHRQREFSLRTFGPGRRTAGNLAHIRKELVEIEANPDDLSEWIDVVLLALDGALRHGGTPESIVKTLEAKQTKNEARTWPDWRTVPEGEAICHVSTQAPGTVGLLDWALKSGAKVTSISPPPS